MDRRLGDVTVRQLLVVAAEVHHLTYERLGDELPEDLAALCAPCHRGAHKATQVP
ncbi:MAG: hypothetical protein ACRDI2_17430 [Chloroflexota bacterium]